MQYPNQMASGSNCRSSDTHVNEFSKFPDLTSLIYFGNGMRWMGWGGGRPPLCANRLNWANTNYWGWWDEWEDTALQTPDSKFEPWRSESEHTASGSRRIPTILHLCEWAGKKFECQSGGRTPRSPTIEADSLNHCTRALALHFCNAIRYIQWHSIVPLDIKGCICHFTNWQIHPFIYKGTISYHD